MFGGIDHLLVKRHVTLNAVPDSAYQQQSGCQPAPTPRDEPHHNRRQKQKRQQQHNDQCRHQIEQAVKDE